MAAVEVTVWSREFVRGRVRPVTIAPTAAAAPWGRDFFIDNVAFTAPPATAAACKDGGWQVAGVFKNQEDCVSCVARHARNAPAG